MWPEKQGLFVPDAGFFLTAGEGRAVCVARGGASGREKGRTAKKTRQGGVPWPGQACAKLEGIGWRESAGVKSWPAIAPRRWRPPWCRP